MKSLVLAFCLTWLFLPLNTPVAFGDSVTLTSGEVMEGTILSETDAELSLQMANKSRTITFTRVLQKSEIKSISRDSPEQKAQQTAYCALDPYKLDQFQNLSTSQYKQGIDAFEGFLSSYPNSTHAQEIRDKLARWKTEADNLQSGKVKSAGRWMTPRERAALQAGQQRSQRLQAARSALKEANSQLANLQLQRSQLAESVPILQANLRTSQNTLAILQDSQEPVYETQVTPSKQYYDHFLGRLETVPARKTVTFVGYKKVPNSQRARLEQEVATYQTQLNEAPRTLTALDAQIADLLVKVRKLEADFQQAQTASVLPTSVRQR